MGVNRKANVGVVEAVVEEGVVCPEKICATSFEDGEDKG